MLRWGVFFACLLVITGATASLLAAEEAVPQNVEKTATNEEFFERNIRPLLLGKCGECHGTKKQESGLRLDTKDAVSRGGDSGPIVVAGDPEKSTLIRAVRYDGDMQMPPEGKLSDQEIAMLTEWVSRGANWPESNAKEGSPVSAAVDLQAAKDHWAFQPVVAPPIPEVADKEWVRAPVDAFILAQLEAHGVKPNPVVDRRTLIRRVFYDLVGLPPTFEEVEAFVNDSTPEAYAQLVERLLASPRYGERWGRHWLDVARYADTKGYVGVDKGDIERREYPYAYAYRDWVIQSINEDLPYDLFLMQQIAADKLPQGDDKSSLAALGLFRVGRVFLNNRHDQIDDKIDVLMRGTQGLTVACARCHDHKFDPIPTADYYSLYGIFDSTTEPDDAERKLMLLADAENPHDVQIFRRGNPASRGEKAPRQFLAVLSGEQREPFHEGSGRLELAQAIASRDNPLTARVFVNRVWDHHFGQGLVETTSDFGIRTEQPFHHALLDYLADQFMNEGWSLKKLHRAIVLSTTYQLSSQQRPDAAEVDPENRLYWRGNRRRLDFEQMRDSMLAASAEIDLTVGGPSVEITAKPYSLRRTVYGRVDRQNLPGMFRTFDFANPDSHSPGRFETTVPQQGLFLMNHPFVRERAAGLLQRLEVEEVVGGSARIERLYECVLSRRPRAEELANAMTFVGAYSMADGETSVDTAWPQLAQALLLTNEFLFVD